MKNTLLKSIVLFASLFLVVNCDDDNDPANNVCQENYVDSSITNAFSGPNGYGSATNTLDLETHEYTVKINADGEICSIGYQNPNTYAGTYTMEIIDDNTMTVFYTGVHSFSQTNIEYITIPVIPITSGDVVIVRRTISSGYTNLNETIGPVIRLSNGSNISYPVAYMNVEFQASNFYGAGGPLNNFAMPIIGLGFKLN